MTETAATDSRPKFVVESVAEFKARVPSPSFKVPVCYTQRTLPDLMNAAEGSLPGYEFTGVIPAHGGVWLTYRRIDQPATAEAAPDANAGMGELLHHRHVQPAPMTASEAAPQVLGTYKDGTAAHMWDVVTCFGGCLGEANMTVTGFTKGETRQLLCEWKSLGFDLDGIETRSKAFNAGDLTLIRRAHEPAVPAEPTQDSAYVFNASGVAVPLGLRGARQAEAAARAALVENADRASRASRAPKVTPADVEAAIASEHYYTGCDGADGARNNINWGEFDAAEIVRELSGVMHCSLVCKNGHVVTGEAFCADLDNPDREAARKSARRRAFDKLYDMVVYAARERLGAAQ